MARVRSSWLIGSIEVLPEQDFTINVAPVTIASGPFYLVHATPAISLLDEMVARMTAAGLANPVAELLENRRVRLAADGVFSITWGSATQLRDFLGFTANLSAASSYIAPNISPYLWSPGYPPTRLVADGIVGHDVEDVEIKVSADGTEQEADFHITHVWDEWRWDAVILDRYDTPAGDGGTWTEFRRKVLVPTHRFQLREFVVEDSTSTAAVSLPAALGTYRTRVTPKANGSRKISLANVRWRVRMKVRVGSEYS